MKNNNRDSVVNVNLLVWNCFISSCSQEIAIIISEEFGVNFCGKRKYKEYKPNIVDRNLMTTEKNMFENSWAGL